MPLFAVHVHVGLLLVLSYLPHGQQQQHVLVSAQEQQLHQPGGGLRRGRQGSSGSQLLKQKRDVLHHWTSFADVVVDLAVADVKATTGAGTGTRRRSSRNTAHSSAAASRDDADDEEQLHRRRLSSKKSSKNPNTRYGDEWMLDMIGGNAE